jgi:diguanylate cyclase (GGDEF)-like protein/PAS domain S-box-containing protein
VDPSALTGLTVGRTRQVDAGNGTVTIATPITSMQGPHRVYGVFQQPASAFYGDIRIGQLLRDASLFLLVLIAVGGLAGTHWRRERIARRERDRLDALLQNAHDIVMVVGPDGSPRFVSSAAQRLLDRPVAGLLGRPLADVVHPEDRDRFRTWLGQSDARRPSLHDIRLLTGAGDPRWFDLECSDLREVPAIGGLLLTCHDSGVRKELQDKLSYQARHDMLTGLPHRGMFVRDLDALAMAAGHPRFAVLYVDLDHFKPVNDAFGHAAGDRVLATVAKRLQASIPPGARVYRLGGDEFAAIVPGADRDRAAAAAEQALAAIRQPQDIEGNTVRIDATIGIALSSGASPDSVSLVARQADHAMYQAKQQGRGRYAFAPAGV